MPNPIVHIEISAPDPAAADQFYAQVFGWKTEVDERFDYHQFVPGEGPAGAFVKVDENRQVGEITPYIGVEDIDATLKQVAAHGGQTILPKTEIPGIGHMAMFVDNSGNRIGLFSGPGPQ